MVGHHHRPVCPDRRWQTPLRQEARPVLEAQEVVRAGWDSGQDVPPRLAPAPLVDVDDAAPTARPEGATPAWPKSMRRAPRIRKANQSDVNRRSNTECDEYDFSFRFAPFFGFRSNV